MKRTALLLALPVIGVALTACGHKKHARSVPPPPPPPAARTSPRTQPPVENTGQSETGIASWYGHPYHGRQAADGEIYDMETLVAAHRTLPFNTWVRVVNLRNNKVVEVRIIDRGPFIEGRIIDLSHAAASAIDLVGPGVGPVRIEVIGAPASANAPAMRAGKPTASTPPPAPANTSRPAPPAPSPPLENTTPGPFAVQVGIYFDHAAAERIRAEMAARYGSARLIAREGLHPMWRLLVGDEPTESAANTISNRLRQESGERNTFVVRLDSY